MKYIIIAETGEFAQGKPLLNVVIDGFELQEVSKVFNELCERVKEKPEMIRGCE